MNFFENQGENWESGMSAQMLGEYTILSQNHGKGNKPSRIPLSPNQQEECINYLLLRTGYGLDHIEIPPSENKNIISDGLSIEMLGTQLILTQEHESGKQPTMLGFDTKQQSDFLHYLLDREKERRKSKGLPPPLPEGLRRNALVAELIKKHKGK